MNRQTEDPNIIAFATSLPAKLRFGFQSPTPCSDTYMNREGVKIKVFQCTNRKKKKKETSCSVPATRPQAPSQTLTAGKTCTGLQGRLKQKKVAKPGQPYLPANAQDFSVWDLFAIPEEPVRHREKFVQPPNLRWYRVDICKYFGFTQKIVR